MLFSEAMQNPDASPAVIYAPKSENVGTFEIAQNSQELNKFDGNPIIRNALKSLLNKNVVSGFERVGVEKTMERLYSTRTLNDCKLAKIYLEKSLKSNKLDTLEQIEVRKALTLISRIINSFDKTIIRPQTSYDLLKLQLIDLKQTTPFFSPAVRS